MRELWITVGILIGIFLVAGIMLSVCCFIGKVWEHINTEPAKMAIHGDLHITPNAEGEVYLGGTFELHNSMTLDGNGSTLKVIGNGPAIKVKKKNTTIKNLNITKEKKHGK